MTFRKSIILYISLCAYPPKSREFPYLPDNATECNHSCIASNRSNEGIFHSNSPFGMNTSRDYPSLKTGVLPVHVRCSLLSLSQTEDKKKKAY
jgi:hypothetical protein